MVVQFIFRIVVMCCHRWSPHTKDWSYSISLLRHRNLFLRGALTTVEEWAIYSLVMTSEGNSMGNVAAEQTVRTREYLTQREIDKLMDAARSGSRYGHRDSTM